MKLLKVELEDRSYTICVGAGIIAQTGLISNLIKGKQCLIVTNQTIAPLYIAPFKNSLARALPNCQIDELILDDGEQFKNTQTLGQIYDHLMQHGHERSTTLIALGGGVIGDITGFAAATYQRGVDFIQVPTTLLAQVDSSVGGKTGVNHPLGKNMIGAFYQPKGVVIDINTLATLPRREFSAGLAEVIKYGLIVDSSFFNWIENNLEKILNRENDALIYAIERSCATKAEIVALDERESGRRALLNFGHTFGHAIEAHQGYGKWLHGEAVSAGMVIAARLSMQLGWLSLDSVTRISVLLQRAGLPIHAPLDMCSDDFFEKMQIDKKVKDGKIRFVLLRDIGHATLEDGVDRKDVEIAINNSLP